MGQTKINRKINKKKKVKSKKKRIFKSSNVNQRQSDVSVVAQKTSNLKRGKLPSNWNSYVDNKNEPASNKKAVSKFPKTLPELTNKSYTSEVSENLQFAGKPIFENPWQFSSNAHIDGIVALDCEMVGINSGGKDNMLARVSIVNEFGHAIYDTFVKPTQPVVDYRTHVSGVTPADLINGREFSFVQHEVHNIIQGKILVGHALHNDLRVLYLSHSRWLIRDTSRFEYFRNVTNGHTPSLKVLCRIFLGKEIQSGAHNSVEDARCTMMLYMNHRRHLESELRLNNYKYNDDDYY